VALNEYTFFRNTWNEKVAQILQLQSPTAFRVFREEGGELSRDERRSRRWFAQRVNYQFNYSVIPRAVIINSIRSRPVGVRARTASRSGASVQRRRRARARARRCISVCSLLSVRQRSSATPWLGAHNNRAAQPYVMLITERRRARAHGCGRLWEMAEVRPGSVQTRCSCTPRGTRVRGLARGYSRAAFCTLRQLRDAHLRAKASIANDDLSRRPDCDLIPSNVDYSGAHDSASRLHSLSLSSSSRCYDVTIIALSRSLLYACARGRHT